jgi:acyl-CoA-dependent ceramide synthase
MTSELKRYYLMQASYWCHQLIVLVLRLEKPRKDYKERVAHHLVTSWLIGFVATFWYICTPIHTIRRWSYGANLTLIGNAVYASMDIPDLFIAMAKMLNYLRWERAQNIMFIVFIGTWT